MSWMEWWYRDKFLLLISISGRKGPHAVTQFSIKEQNAFLLLHAPNVFTWNYSTVKVESITLTWIRWNAGVETNVCCCFLLVTEKELMLLLNFLSKIRLHSNVFTWYYVPMNTMIYFWEYEGYNLETNWF